MHVRSRGGAVKVTDRKVLPTSKAAEWWEVEYQEYSYQQYAKTGDRYPKRRLAMRAAKRRVLAEGHGTCRVVRVLEIRFTGFYGTIPHHRATQERQS